MNKKIFSYLTVTAMAAAGLPSCSEEQTLPVGEGTLYISTRINSDVVVESRAEAEEDLAATTKVWIYSPEGVVRKFNGMSEIPTSGLKLLSGNYTIKAWAGKAEYASFNSRWFEGRTEVEVRPNDAQAVEVVCKIANVVASVKYPDNVDNLISDYSMTIGHKGGSLTFEGNDPEKKGYYMMPEGVTALDYTLNFSTLDGEAKSVNGTIENVAPTHQYILNVIANSEEDKDDGAAFITIEVDESTIDIEDEIIITTPPSITGHGFDINAPVAGENGAVGRKSVYVCAASEITELEVSGIERLDGFSTFNFIHASSERIEELAAKGISHEVQEVPEGQIIKVIFDDTYLNTLPNREDPYVFTITATDKGEKTATARLTLHISEASVYTAPIADDAVSYTGATVSATIAKDGIESAGFEYAPAGTEDWQYIEGGARAAFTKGQVYYATITGLNVAATYKYRAVINHGTEMESTGEEQEFTTLNGPQLPNSSFENWRTDGKVMIPMPSGTDFWDSGNHGSSTMNVNLTQQDTSLKHSGNSSAKLRSQFVGFLGIGAFAAGNIFTGKFIGIEDSTNGVVGFGQPFDFPADIKPTAIKLWVKYSTTNDWKGNANHKPASGYDEGHIFTALFDAPDNDPYNSDNNGKYGYVVHTSGAKRLFDKNASNVIAYGEKVFTESTADSGLVEITIPYEYYRDARPKLIAVVCTASKYGDYFQGGEGATMWVDDVEIVYTTK